MAEKREKIKLKKPEDPSPKRPTDRVDDSPPRKVIDLKKLAEEEPKGEYLNQLLSGEALEVVTKNHTYLVEKYGDDYYISGHPQYCPSSTKVSIRGSTWGGSALKVGFIGEDMKLEFTLPDGRTITTSFIKKVTKKSTSGTIQ